MKVERPRARSSAAPTRENSRSTTPMRAPARRHEAAHLRQHGDQRVLAQKGRFARHVRAGDQPDAPGRLCPRQAGGDRSQSLATNGPPSLAERLLDHRMAPAVDGEGEASIDLGPHVVALDRERGERRRDVERRRAPRAACLDRGARRRSRVAASRSKISSSIASARSAALAIFASSSPSSVVVKRTWPASVWRWMKVALSGARHQLVAVLRRHFDEIAEHIVVPDLQRADAGLLGIARLQRGDRRGAIRRAARGPRRARAS